MKKSQDVAAAIEAAAIEFINTAARRTLNYLATTEDGLGAAFDDSGRVSVFTAEASAPGVNREIARNRLSGQASLVLFDLAIAFDDEDKFDDELAALADDELRARLLNQVGFVELDDLVRAEIDEGEGNSLD